MKNNKSFLSIILLFVILITNNNIIAKTYTLNSPNTTIQLSVIVDNGITFILKKDSNILISKGVIDFKLPNLSLSELKVESFRQGAVRETIKNDFSVKNKIDSAYYNELIINFKKNLTLNFRVYNSGFAYRIESDINKNIKVISEPIELKFPKKSRVWFPKEESMLSHNERLYIDTILEYIEDNSFASLPILIQTQTKKNLLITEADLYDYPGMFLEKKDNGLHSKFPQAVKYIKENTKSVGRSPIIEEEYEYIAKTYGVRTFPWRVFIIADNDKGLLDNQLVYNLSTSNVIDSTDWIKPGKVSWDWWNNWNIYGVDFKSGINTLTYKYYIDFASKYSIEYIIMDDGWAKDRNNIIQSNDNLDLQYLINYADNKKVGIILWVYWKTLIDDIDNILSTYEHWGIKGIKVDFMQRSDQDMVNIYENIAKKAAEYHLIVDFHGAYKSTGLNRKYPNVLTQEGVRGLENAKWSKDNTPDFNLILPFIRNVVGPMDYTPGAMRNTHENNYSISWNRPMSMGTRANQIAMYIVYESPLQMLADSPSNYYKESECVEFISRIPTVWDKTVPIEAKIGDYVVIARKNNNTWYIAGMNDETQERQINIDLSFLKDGIYNVDILKDGINSDNNAEDYIIEHYKINTKDSLNIIMKKGGGFSAILNPETNFINK